MTLELQGGVIVRPRLRQRKLVSASCAQPGTIRTDVLAVSLAGPVRSGVRSRSRKPHTNRQRLVAHKRAKACRLPRPSEMLIEHLPDG